MSKRDWATVAVAIVAAAAIIGVYAVMQQRNSELRSDLSRITVERDALQSGLGADAADVQALVAERDRLQERVAKLTTRIGELEAAPVGPTHTPTPAAAAAASSGNVSGTIGDGVYLVGTDISAGRYKGSVTASSGMGYWCISSDANGEEIIQNDLPTGQFYVEVQNGQYLQLTGVVIGQ